MKLQSALSIYELEGPHSGLGNSHSSGANATRIVHMHLTPTEMANIVKAWNQRATVGKGGFFRQLQEVRDRLASIGSL